MTRGLTTRTTIDEETDDKDDKDNDKDDSTHEHQVEASNMALGSGVETSTMPAVQATNSGHVFSTRLPSTARATDVTSCTRDTT